MSRGAERTWPQRLLIALNLGLVAVSAAGIAFGVVVYERIHSIPSVDIGSNPSSAPAGSPRATGVQNFLIVGSDTRAGQDDAVFGSVAGQRADVILLIRVDFDTHAVSMLSLPRDLYVNIYDSNGRDVGLDRINTAFAGGPAQLVTTIRTLFGIPVDHYLQVNFEGFRDAVDAIDGVDVYLAGAVRDRDQRGRNVSGLDITADGCVRLDGTQTLAYIRSRHFQQLIDGHWKPDPTGDLGRISRQHDLARRIASQAIGRGLLNPATILSLVDAAHENLVIDSGLSPAQLVDFGQQMGGTDPGAISQPMLAVTNDTTSAGAAVLRLDETPENARILDLFRGAPTQPPPDDVESPLAPTSATTVTVAEPTC